MELCEVFARCGLDVLLITVANAALAILLKRTLLKKRPKAVTAMCFIAPGATPTRSCKHFTAAMSRSRFPENNISVS